MVTITDIVKDSGGNPIAKAIVGFTPRLPFTATGGRCVVPTEQTTIATNEGDFTISLLPGRYWFRVDGQNQIKVTVPDTAETLTIEEIAE